MLEVAGALLVMSLGSALLSAYVADEKGRDPLVWGCIGFVTNVMALIALAAVPSVERERVH